MKPKIEGWSIVVAGYWDISIFRPEWIKNYLTESEEILIEFLKNPLFLPRFRFDGMVLSIFENKLILNPETCEDKLFEQVHEVAAKILSELPHIPIIATGINLQFTENDPSPEMLRIFEINDLSKFSDNGYKIETTLIRRRIPFKKHVLNLELLLEKDSTLSVSFNFHCDAKNADEAKQFIEENKMSNLKERALKILESVYTITVDFE